MAPAKTPEPVLQKLGADLRTALNHPELKQKFEMIGTFSLPSSVRETQDYIRAEQELWRQIGVD